MRGLRSVLGSQLQRHWRVHLVRKPLHDGALSPRSARRHRAREHAIRALDPRQGHPLRQRLGRLARNGARKGSADRGTRGPRIRHRCPRFHLRQAHADLARGRALEAICGFAAVIEIGLDRLGATARLLLGPCRHRRAVRQEQRRRSHRHHLRWAPRSFAKRAGFCAGPRLVGGSSPHSPDMAEGPRAATPTAESPPARRIVVR